MYIIKEYKVKEVIKMMKLRKSVGPYEIPYWSIWNSYWGMKILRRDVCEVVDRPI